MLNFFNFFNYLNYLSNESFNFYLLLITLDIYFIKILIIKKVRIKLFYNISIIEFNNYFYA